MNKLAIRRHSVFACYIFTQKKSSSLYNNNAHIGHNYLSILLLLSVKKIK